MPTVCMKKDRMVNFMGDFTVISIKESNLQLMKAWNNHYQKHKEVVDKGGIVPLFKNVSAYQLGLVNDALTIGPYKFGEHYKNLSKKDKSILIKASGQYSKYGKKLMLHVPELTKQLIDVVFTDDGIHTHIKKYLKDNEEDDVRNYFKEKLIYGKRLLGSFSLKQPILTSTNDLLRENIYPASLFLNAYHTNHSDSTILLSIGDKVHQTYATHFITDTHEYRITDIKGKQCSLWVINHENIDNTNYTFATSIEHKGDIKGCCFSKTGTGVEHAITYSDCDIVISKITTHNDISFVESKQLFNLENRIIADVCFNQAQDGFFVGMYMGMDSIIQQYRLDTDNDTFNNKLATARFPFKKHGLLEKMFIGRNASGDDFFIAVFGIAGQYGILLYKHNNVGGYGFNHATKLCTMERCNRELISATLLKRGNSIFMYDYSYSPFAAVVEAEQKKTEQNWFVKDLIDGSVLKLDSDCYCVYSPDGTFLLCNSLIKKSELMYVETVLKDAVTHKQIVSIDTLYKDFLGVGFSNDGTELIFLNSSGFNYKVALLNDDDKKILCEMEKVAFKQIGVTSLLKRLCMECKKNGTVALQEDDPACIMLLDWSYKPMMLSLLAKCLPLYKIKRDMSTK
jgi:hypothetical protein